MKTILQFILLTSLVIFSACGTGNKQDSTNSDESSLIQNNINSVEFELDSISLSKLKKVYFLNLDLYRKNNLLRGYSEPNDSSQIVAGFSFGDTIPVLEERKDGWLVVYAGLGQRKHDSSKSKAFIKKSELGDIKDLVLKEKDFRFTSDEREQFKYIGDDTLNIQIITEREFQTKKKTYSSPIQDIKQGVKQDEGSLSLVTGNGIINLKDKNPLIDTTLYDDQVLTYSYEGFNKQLNAFLIKQQEWETSSYSLYSQATGEQISTTSAYPVFSSDNIFLADINFNPYEYITELSLQKRDNKGKYQPYISFQFVKWAPFQSSKENIPDYFFSDNNTLYLKTIIIEGAGTTLEKVNNLQQFIKIIIVSPE